MKNFSILFVACLLFYAGNAHAQLLSHDDFEVDLGTETTLPVNGLSTGFGWGGAWDAQSGEPGYYVTRNFDFSYPGIASSPNHLVGGGNYRQLGRQFDLTPAGTFAGYLNGDGNIGLDGTTLYLSFIAENLDGSYRVGLSRGIPWAYGNEFAITSSSDKFSITMNNVNYPTTIDFTLNTIYLVVVKLEFDAANGNTVSLWVNPTDLGGAEPAADFTVTGVTGDDISFQNLNFYPNNGNKDGHLDEIRVGVTYADVTPKSPPVSFFNFTEINPAAIGTIDHDANTIELDVPFGTDLTTLVPSIGLSPGTTILPESGVANDFTQPIVYTATLEDASTEDYTVTVNVLPARTADTLWSPALEYDFSSISGTVDNTANTITFNTYEGMPTEVPFSFTVDLFATTDINAGSNIDITAPPAITVTAQDGSERMYTLIVNQNEGISAFTQDFSNNITNWEVRNWNNSGTADAYTLNLIVNPEDATDSILQITKSATKNHWIRYSLPDSLNLGLPGTDVRMRLSSAQNINDFGLRLQDVDAPEPDGNFSVATNELDEAIQGGAGFQEILWNFDNDLDGINPYLIKYLVFQADRTTETIFTDIRIDDLRLGYDAYANNAPKSDPVSNPPKTDVNDGTQSLLITGITDGNPERDENITITATSSNQAVVPDANINVTYDDVAGTALVEYTPLANGAATITVEIQDDRGKVYSDEEDTKEIVFVAQFIDNTPGVNDLATFGIPSYPHINVGAGNQHYVIIPNVDDGDPDMEQELIFDYTVDSTNMISVDSLVHQNGDNFAILYFKDLGVTGNAAVTVSVIDAPDQTAGNDPFELQFHIPLGIYNTFGAYYGATDVQQWQPMPYNTDATMKDGYPVLIQETYQPDDASLNFFWGKMWGYIIPPVTGNYKFFTDSDGEGNASFFLSSDATSVGLPAVKNPTASRDGGASPFIELEAGKAYYFEALHKEIINDFFLEVEWIYPGGSRERIAAPNLFYMLDQELPAAPTNLTEKVVGSNQAIVAWDEATDNDQIAGYVVYVNGVAYNNELIQSTETTITGLDTITDYDIMVVAVDQSENYGLLSDVLKITTFGIDNTPPSAPTNVTATETTTFSISLSWDPASDNETAIYGYNIYLDGSTEPFNQEPVLETSYKVIPLDKTTEYSITVVALDAALNTSAPSSALLASTTEFNWDNPNEDVHMGLVTVNLDNVAPATGFAIEGDYGLGSIFLSNKVGYPSFEDERFVDQASNEVLAELDKEKSGGITFLVEETDVFHGNRAAKLEVLGGEYFRTIANITMSDNYNYILKFAIKRDAQYEGAAVDVSVFKDIGGKNTAYTTSVTPTGEWVKHTLEFPGITEPIDQFKIEFAFNQLGTIYLDDVELHVKEWYDPNSKFTTVGMDILDELQPSGIRWGAIGANYDNFFESVGEYQKGTMTYGDFLYLSSLYNGYGLITVGVNSETDWMKDPATFSNFIEYMNGPAGTTWGDVRIAEGYADPFGQTLNDIFIEMGNEVWGFNSHGADAFKDNNDNNDYDLYAQWAADMSKNYIKTSPYFDPDKMYVAFSGRSPDNNYGLHRSLFENEDNQMDMLLISGYLGGNLDYDPSIPEGESQLDYHKNSYYSFNSKIKGLHSIFEEMLLRMGRIVPQYMYEGNLTRPEYNGTSGQAVTFADYYATTMENGVTVPNVFTLEGGQWRLIDNEVTLKRRTLYYHVMYYNQFCKDGEILRTNYQSRDSIFNDNGSLIHMPSVGAHAYHDNGQFGIALYSRDFENDYEVMLDIPDEIGAISNGKMVVITSAKYNSLDVAVEETSITVSDSMVVTVPKYAAVYISFDADPQSLEVKPLGNFEYTQVTEIVVTPRQGRTTLSGESDQINLDVQVLPESAFFTRWDYEFIDNSAKLFFRKFDNRLSVEDTSVNGTSTIRFYAMDGSGVYTDVEITVTDIGVSVEDHYGNDVLSVYPNPVKDNLSVTLSEVRNARYEIFSLTGNKIMEGLLHNNQNAIDVSAIADGMYIIKIDNQGSVHTVRFTKE